MAARHPSPDLPPASEDHRGGLQLLEQLVEEVVLLHHAQPSGSTEATVPRRRCRRGTRGAQAVDAPEADEGVPERGRTPIYFGTVNIRLPYIQCMGELRGWWT